MSNAACKVAIDSGMRSDLKVLRDRTLAFEQVAVGNLADNNPAWQAAIAIDLAARDAVQKAIAAYDKLTLSVAESL